MALLIKTPTRRHHIMKYLCKGLNILNFRSGQILVNEKKKYFESYEECIKDLVSGKTIIKHAWQHNIITVSRYHTENSDQIHHSYFEFPHVYPQYGWIIIITRANQKKDLVISQQICSTFDMAEKEVYSKILDMYKRMIQSSSVEAFCHLDFHITVTFLTYD